MSEGRECKRLRVLVNGLVQGVGFRPFVYRLAHRLGVTGWVLNSAQGVTIEVEGPSAQVDAFLQRLDADKPPRAAIHSLKTVVLEPCGLAGFEIRSSATAGVTRALALPDIATCPDCRRELLTPGDRRYRYPFINCTNCGPRFSIILSLPYDRPQTTMRGFAMCPECAAEYRDPENRRFHAQPDACPVCGPQLALWDGDGRILELCEAALQATEAALRRGLIVAVKGLGGFHLMADARNRAAVGRLRLAKHREEKPFAIMYPDLDVVRRHCRVSTLEERILQSPEAPIVLLERRPGSDELSPGVAPANPRLGVMLPYTPLHHLLLLDMGTPVVATSGNRADEPICTEEREALIRLRGIADLFLVHDRPIQRHLDDSIVQVVAGREMIVRRARGYAPLPVGTADPARSVIAVGAQLKGAASVVAGGRIFVGQHIGDLENPLAVDALERSIRDLQTLYGVRAQAVAADLHPDYASTRLAAQLAASGQRSLAVQHHHAHVLACMADNELDGEVLGVAWDGTGLGPDQTIWGGEFLLATRRGFRRLAHLRTFPLPGGEAAVREPRRSALGLLYELLGEAALARADLAPVQSFTAAELRVVGQMLRRGLHAPVTSSAGRLFDAVASLCGLRQRLRYEGQAAMQLEHLIDSADDGRYVTGVRPGQGQTLVVDWGPMVLRILDDLAAGVSVGRIAARFHNTLVEVIVEVSLHSGLERIVLTGGCMQNRYLTERTVKRLRAAGLRPYWHQRVPPNDGGISLGQAAAALAADDT